MIGHHCEVASKKVSSKKLGPHATAGIWSSIVNCYFSSQLEIEMRTKEVSKLWG